MQLLLYFIFTFLDQGGDTACPGVCKSCQCAQSLDPAAWGIPQVGQLILSGECTDIVICVPRVSSAFPTFGAP